MRIVQAFEDIGVTVSEEVAFAAWRRFSEEDRSATWYLLGNDDVWIRECIMPYLKMEE